MAFETELKLVEEWASGDCGWDDLPNAIRRAVDEVMAEMALEESEKGTVTETNVDKELIQKSDSEKRFTLGPWYIPNRYDAHGEWTDAEELQKALWEYVRSGDRRIRLQHNKDIVAGEWVEAMTMPVEITMGMKKDATSKQVTYPTGTVFLGVQWKPWAWELVKNGKITGFSIGGAAARIEALMPEGFDKAKSFGGDRSAAGRYAANQRWANAGVSEKSPEKDFTGGWGFTEEKRQQMRSGGVTMKDGERRVGYYKKDFYERQLANALETQRKLKAGETTPTKILGSGLKSKKMANAYIQHNIDEATEALKMFEEHEAQMATSETSQSVGLSPSAIGASALNRYRAMGKFMVVGTMARGHAARAARLKRKAAGRETLVDKIRGFFYREYEQPEPREWTGTEWRDPYEGQSRSVRPSDRYYTRTGRDNRGTADVSGLPSGKKVIMQDGKLTTVGKSREEIKARMRVLAKTKSFGGNRSEAGRYAANCRWQRYFSGQESGPFASMPRTKLGRDLKTEIESRNASSLTTHLDYDALAAEMKRRKMSLSDPEAPELVYKYLSPERQGVWKQAIAKYVMSAPDGGPDGVQIYIKGGGGASGKSTSGKIEGMDYEFPATIEDAAKQGKSPEAALINVDDFKTDTAEFKTLNAHGRRMGEEECRRLGISPESDQGKQIMKKNFAKAGAATFVHEESSLVGKMMMSLAIKLGKDVVMDGTMDNGVNQRLKELKFWRSQPNVKAMKMIVFSCDVEEAVRRAAAREVDSKSASYGRVVPPEVLADAHIKVSRNMPDYLASGLFDDIMVIDTNDRPSTPMAHAKDGRNLTIINPDKYKRFTDKATKDAKDFANG